MSRRARGSGLKRELGPLTAMLFTAGMMVGIGIFATLGAATEAAGSGSVIALAFATYLGQIIPGAPPHLVAAVGVLAVIGLNLFGIQLTSRVLIGLLTSPAFSWYGIIGCVGPTIAMPRAAVLAAAGTLAVLTVSRFVLRVAMSHGRFA